MQNREELWKNRHPSVGKRHVARRGKNISFFIGGISFLDHNIDPRICLLKTAPVK
jgi:hypothetical protein